MKSILFVTFNLADQLSNIGFCFGSSFNIQNYALCSSQIYFTSAFCLCCKGNISLQVKNTNLSYFHKITGYIFFIISHTILNWFKLFGHIELIDKILDKIKQPNEEKIDPLKIKVNQDIIMGLTETIPNIVLQFINNYNTDNWSAINIISIILSIFNLIQQSITVIVNLNIFEIQNYDAEEFQQLKPIITQIKSK